MEQLTALGTGYAVATGAIRPVLPYRTGMNIL